MSLSLLDDQFIWTVAQDLVDELTLLHDDLSEEELTEFVNLHQ